MNEYKIILEHRFISNDGKVNYIESLEVFRTEDAHQALREARELIKFLNTKKVNQSTTIKIKDIARL